MYLLYKNNVLFIFVVWTMVHTITCRIALAPKKIHSGVKTKWTNIQSSHPQFLYCVFVIPVSDRNET